MEIKNILDFVIQLLSAQDYEKVKYTIKIECKSLGYFPNAGYIQSTVFHEEYEQMNKADVMWISETERSDIDMRNCFYQSNPHFVTTGEPGLVPPGTAVEPCCCAPHESKATYTVRGLDKNNEKIKTKNEVPQIYHIIPRREKECFENNWNKGFPGGSVVKSLPARAGDVGLIPDLGRFHMQSKAAKPVLHSYRACALKPGNCIY
ncbi:hypothetical protein MG293_013264 [Ovis ammon polii]|uniref:Uncharacterized protein n=1 Tax=Ovis ammon polii TaxID=230172 RepID=A0AAD4U215_OVIAM|nr:hypothetical protein MG293_013264 [Ovis ammon polii]